MKKKRFSEEQIIGAIKRYEAGEKAEKICRDVGIAINTFYIWRRKFGGMEVSEAKRLKELEEENRRLKNKVAELVLDNDMLKFINSKKW